MSQKAKQLIAQAKAEKWKRLDLSYCGITNLTTEIPELFEITDLAALFLQGNELTDVSPLSGLSELTELVINDNQLTDVSPLSGLRDLKKLYLSFNQVTDVSSLSGLTALTEFYYRVLRRYDNNYWSFRNPDNGYVALRLQCSGDIVRGCSRYSKVDFITTVETKYGSSHPYIEWAMK